MESPPDHRPRLGFPGGVAGRALDFPAGQVVKNPACRGHGSIPGPGRARVSRANCASASRLLKPACPSVCTTTKRGARPLQLKKARAQQ